MDWTDDGIVLSARRHGETSAIVQVLTAAHGRHAGLVRGGAGKRARGLYQPGNQVRATWRARLSEHLGTYTCELTTSRAAGLMDEPPRLAALSAACAVAEAALPEREIHAPVYNGFIALLDALDNGTWPEVYVRWELGLLAELGYGLELDKCAATGRNDQLAWVSPRSGRAVSLSAGERWRDRMLALPAFLTDGSEAPAADILAGLRLTGFFLDAHLFRPFGRVVPAARARLEDRFTQLSTGKAATNC
jgi:DNA repair protein RecO (recombination protein O)